MFKRIHGRHGQTLSFTMYNYKAEREQHTYNQKRLSVQSKERGRERERI